MSTWITENCDWEPKSLYTEEEAASGWSPSCWNSRAGYRVSIIVTCRSLSLCSCSKTLFAFLGEAGTRDTSNQLLVSCLCFSLSHFQGQVFPKTVYFVSCLWMSKSIISLSWKPDTFMLWTLLCQISVLVIQQKLVCYKQGNKKKRIHLSTTFSLLKSAPLLLHSLLLKNDWDSFGKAESCELSECSRGFIKIQLLWQTLLLPSLAVQTLPVNILLYLEELLKQIRLMDKLWLTQTLTQH